jgi:integrase
VLRGHHQGRARKRVADPAEFVPLLEEALLNSPSDVVFPRPDGKQHRADVALHLVLRRALGRLGIVTGYQHVCRRKGCGHTETSPRPETKVCPGCSMKLWVKPIPKRLRFHDLRHTCATLLLKRSEDHRRGALRHPDPDPGGLPSGQLGGCCGGQGVRPGAPELWRQRAGRHGVSPGFCQPAAGLQGPER